MVLLRRSPCGGSMPKKGGRATKGAIKNGGSAKKHKKGVGVRGILVQQARGRDEKIYLQEEGSHLLSMIGDVDVPEIRSGRHFPVGVRKRRHR
jgi:hypothetical protein